MKYSFDSTGPVRNWLLGAALVALMGLGGAISAVAQPFATPDKNFKGQVFAASQHILPGSEVEVAGRGFKAGQKVTLLSGTSTLNTQPYTVGSNGEFKGTVKLPSNITPGIYPVVVSVSNPSAASVFNLKVSPNIPKSGAERFDIRTGVLVPGVYQVAYSAKNNALFVTSAIGRPPVKESQLVRVNPNTLAIEKSITPAKNPAHSDGRVFAVYGVGVDDANDTVWVTNTRDGTVAVYRQADLSLVKQFETGLVAHSRDVIVDAKRGKAYASAAGGNTIAVFDTKKLAFVKNIEIQSGERFEKFAPTSLELDVRSGKLFTVSMSTPEAAIINVDTDAVEKLIPLPAVRSAIGVSYDAASGRLYVVSQGSDDLVIVETETGKVVKEVLVGAAPLNVAYEPVGKLAYITNRASGTLAVVDGNGNLVANLDAGTFVNHLQEDGKGNVFVVNKAGRSKNLPGDEILRISPKK